MSNNNNKMKWCSPLAATTACCCFLMILSSGDRGTVQAFAPPQQQYINSRTSITTTTRQTTTTTTTSTTTGRSSGRSSSHLSALPPLPAEFVVVDPNIITTTMASTSHWLAGAAAVAATSDAAAAATSDAAAATAAAGDVGWWAQYINLFKITLELVHTTISGPLQAVGIQQTWGISIFVFTALIRSALVPLSIQQSKSAEYMKTLRPYVSEIKNKYKDNEKMQNQAIGRLYEDAEQNPLAGCFTSLIQLPVFLGLYRGVRLLAMDGVLNEKFLWIPSLEGPVSPPDYRGLEWLTGTWMPAPPDSNLPIPPLGWETTIAFLIMPVILVVLQSITMQVLQPPSDDNMDESEQGQMETTQQVLKFLPLLIGFFSLQVPAGLTIYWFTSNIFTLTQSLSVRAYFAANPPKIELPDYWDNALSGDVDNMTPEERRQASAAGIRVGPTIEDMLTEARFHSYIERPSLRTTLTNGSVNEAQAAPAAGHAVPSELEAWVKESSSSSRSSSSSTAVQAEASG